MLLVLTDGLLLPKDGSLESQKSGAMPAGPKKAAKKETHAAVAAHDIRPKFHPEV